MKRYFASILSAAALGATLVVAATPALAYVCPGGSTDYAISCTGVPDSLHLPCIKTSVGTGCCGPGVCNSQVCDTPQTQTACNDGNQCTLDACTTAGGGNNDPICSASNVQNGTACELDNPINQCRIDQCQSGVCTFVGNVDCSGNSVPDPQCQVSACNPNNGNCTTQNANEGADCNDRKDCTYGEVCNNGTCGGGAGGGFLRPNGTPCWDYDWCKPGTCNGSDKGCKNRVSLAAGAACDPNGCTNATCATAGGNCVVNSCATGPLCVQCGNSNCANAPSHPTAPCGCLSEPIYNPPN